MKKYAKVINNETKLCEVGSGTNTVFYRSIGMVEQEVEQAYDGNWYLSGFAPQKTVSEQNEEIRQAREAAYKAEADKIKQDYDEALARVTDNAEALKTAWLAKKDEVRTNYPYVTVGDCKNEQ